MDGSAGAEVVAYRIANHDTPFWAGPNRAPHRYNKQSSGPVQYWSLHPLTPWAEVMRGQGLRTATDLTFLRQRIWAARLSLPDVTEISFTTARDHGLKPRDLVGDDYGPCQAFGDRCVREASMPKAIRVPSAALPGTSNLVLFRPLVRGPYLLDAIAPEDGPTAVVADKAQPPTALIDLVNHFGASHPELASWKAGEPYYLDEPEIL